jgi:hypothetical protein
MFAFVPTLFMHLSYILSTYVGGGTPLVRSFHFYASSSYLLYYALYLLIIPVHAVIVANPVQGVPGIIKSSKLTLDFPLC